MKAIWEGTVVAKSDATIVVEGNYYFPKESLVYQYFIPSETKSTCPWKGEAEYYTIKVGDKENKDAAWCYKEPKEAAIEIKDHIAFWKGVNIEE
ncbi:MAG: DUF427 domain-containing protein [Candidatus Magasanikbacteria bacterium]|nr:DUF427 domain-containing protein [Candidatus Magasanikbacteria bacterium]